MKALLVLIVLGLITKEATSRDIRPIPPTALEKSDESSVKATLPQGCYDGTIDVKTCCDGVTEFWVHIPDPTDCTKFYHCDNGKAVHKDCPAGLHWSIAADRCEWPDNAACKIQSGKPTQLPIEEEIISSEEPIVGPTNPPVKATTVETEQPTDAPVQKTTVTEVVPTNPPVEETTIAPPSEVTTEDVKQPTEGPIQETTDGFITPTDTPDKPTESPVEVSTQAPVKLPAGCYDGIIDVKVCCEGVTAWYVHLPDPEDCTKFYHCDNGVAVRRDCPAGLHWSIAADRCEWPENAECLFEPSKPTSPPIKENTSTPTTEDPNEESTNPEIIEPTDVPVVKPTDEPIIKPTDPPTGELTTNAPIQETTVHAVDPTYPPEESTDTPILEPTDPPAKVTTTEQAEQTDAPTHETTIGEVIYPTNPASTDAPIIASTNPPPEETTGPILETTEETVQSTTNPTLPGGCYDGSINVTVCCEGITAWWVHLPNPNDCGKFYQCDNGKAVDKDCPAGLHWSIGADRCEWPDKAGCETQSSKTTDAPIVDTTTEEVSPISYPDVPTDKPIVEPSSPSVVTTTEIAVPTDGPIQETTEGSEVTIIPPEETNTPIIDPTIPPVETTTAEVYEPTEAPIEETTEGSGESSNPPDEMTDAPIIDSTISPVETTTQRVQEPTDDPIETTTTFVVPTKTEPVITETEPATTVTEPITTIKEPVPTATESAATEREPTSTITEQVPTEPTVPTETESVSTPSEPTTPTQNQTTTEHPWSTTQINNATEPNPDICEPTPICHKCLTGVFPAEQCCTDVQNWQKIKLANAYDCTSYYECINEAAILRKCPDELHWSSKSDRCEWPKNSECVLSTTEASVETTIRNGDGNGTTPESGGISEDCLFGKVDTATCCQNVPYWIDVLLQNNNNCHTFYQCVHGVPTVRPCPSHLWWSVTANRCEWLENATCTWETNN